MSRWRDELRVPPGQELVVQDDLGGQIPKIEDGPWPSFPADLTSIAVVTATQARGTILVFEKMFESRLFFVDKLVVDGRAHHPLRPAPRGGHRAGRLYGERHHQPGHPRRDGDAARGALRRGDVRDRQHPRDRPRLRADRRAPARPRRQASNASTRGPSATAELDAAEPATISGGRHPRRSARSRAGVPVAANHTFVPSDPTGTVRQPGPEIARRPRPTPRCRSGSVKAAPGGSPPRTNAIRPAPKRARRVRSTTRCRPGSDRSGRSVRAAARGS